MASASSNKYFIMNLQIITQRGIAILESSIVMLFVLTLLLGAWGAVELYQRGAALEEHLENSFYDGAVSGFQSTQTESGYELTTNRHDSLNFLNKKTRELAAQFETAKLSPSDFLIQGALVEVRWPKGAEPQIERISVPEIQGAASLPHQLQPLVDFQQLASAFLKRLRQQGTARERFIRPDLWNGENTDDNAITPSFTLIGLSAALSVEDGLSSYLLRLSGQEPFIIRTTFNTLRRDL